MATAEATDITRLEFTAKDVCKILAPMFPDKVVSMALLNFYKIREIVVPQGFDRKHTNRSGRYTYRDVLALAVVFVLGHAGLAATPCVKALRRIQRGGRCDLIEYKTKRARVSVAMDGIEQELEERVREFVKR